MAGFRGISAAVLAHWPDDDVTHHHQGLLCCRWWKDCTSVSRPEYSSKCEQIILLHFLEHSPCEQNLQGSSTEVFFVLEAYLAELPWEFSWFMATIVDSKFHGLVSHPLYLYLPLPGSLPEFFLFTLDRYLHFRCRLGLSYSQLFCKLSSDRLETTGFYCPDSPSLIFWNSDLLVYLFKSGAILHHSLVRQI